MKAINAAYVEAASAFRGVGLVKLMGRQSGFIALNSSLASGEVDICLIPETRFDLRGDKGLLKHIERILDAKGHCVVVVAEGAYQEEISTISAKDASGNPILEDVSPSPLSCPLTDTDGTDAAAFLFSLLAILLLALGSFVCLLAILGGEVSEKRDQGVLFYRRQKEGGSQVHRSYLHDQVRSRPPPQAFPLLDVISC